MSEDILHRLRTMHQNADLNFTPAIYNESLVLIEDIFPLIANEALANLGIPAPNRAASDLFNHDMQRLQS